VAAGRPIAQDGYISAHGSRFLSNGAGRPWHDRGLHLAADNECQNTREKVTSLMRPRETVPPHPQG
jgi:hypothetical protein